MPKYPTLLDLMKKHGSDSDVGLIEEGLRTAPELRAIPGRFIKGTTVKSLVRTSLPTARFRSPNEGIAGVVSTWEERQYQAFVLSSLVICDQAIADAAEDGANVHMAFEADGALQGSYRTVGKQLYYGQDTDAGGDSKGFPGLIAQHDTSMVVDAGGSTADTGSSVWAIKFGIKDAGFIFGGRDVSGGPLKISGVTQQLVVAENGLHLPAYVMNITGWLGFAVGSKYAVGRIKKLTAEPGCGLNDDLIADLLSKFPGEPPDALFMSRRSQMQLKNSRTAWNEKGLPAPFPVEALGVPIHVTDSISDTESLAL